MTRRHSAVSFESLEDRLCLASVPFQLADTNVTPQGSSPHLITEFGEHVLFAVNDRQTGYAFWKTDGTEAGTELITSIRPSESFIYAAHLLGNLGNNIVFVAEDIYSDQVDLWVTDGTPEGSTVISSLGSDNDYVSVTDSLVMDGEYYFLLSRNGYSELWVSDGTETGTRIVNTLNDNSPSYASNLASVDHGIIFTIHIYEQPSELWSSNGTTAGTAKITLLGNSWIPGGDFATAEGSTYFFTQSREGIDRKFRTELWKTDGTEAGTRAIHTFERSSELSRQPIIVLNDTILFFASDENLIDQLWTVDPATDIVEPLTDSTRSLRPSILHTANNYIYFTTYGVYGVELWKSDGTGDGTQVVMSFGQSSFGDGAIQHLASIDDQVYFSVDAGDGVRLWTSDGTEAGTRPLGDVREPEHIEPIRSTLYLSANDPVGGRELFRVDPVSGDASLVKDISLGTADAVVGNWIDADDKHIFTSQPHFLWAPTGEVSIWETTGVQETTIRLSSFPSTSLSVTEQDSILVGDSLYWLQQNNRSYVVNVWVRHLKDQTEEQLTFFAHDNVLLPGPPRIRGLLAVGDKLILKSDNQLWALDEATPDGASLFFDFGESGYTWDHHVLSTNANSFLMFHTDADSDTNAYSSILNRTNVLTGTTTNVAAFDGRPAEVILLNDHLVFRIYNDRDETAQLWTSDGTSEGTQRLPVPNQGHPFPPYSLTANELMPFFVYYYRAQKKELWTTDGTPDSTKFIADLSRFPQLNSNELIPFGNWIYFSAWDKTVGEELWV
ncbi:MAG: hypothetical protein KDB27_07505, partial [Planctomycetales bacterium]|nr:hypothetical protein [Planctomycetales bacterium]